MRLPLIGLGIIALIGSVISITQPSGTTTTTLTVAKVNTLVNAIGITHLAASGSRTYGQFCNPTTSTATIYVFVTGEPSSAEIAPGSCYTDNSIFMGNIINIFVSTTNVAVTSSPLTVTTN